MVGYQVKTILHFLHISYHARHFRFIGGTRQKEGTKILKCLDIMCIRMVRIQVKKAD
jgi:hypothetical protein